MKKDFYFTLYLTESEHSIVEWMIREECAKRNINILYYRRFKTGHVGCYRECKIDVEPIIGQQLLKDLDITGWGNYWNDSQI